MAKKEKYVCNVSYNNAKKQFTFSIPKQWLGKRLECVQYGNEVLIYLADTGIKSTYTGTQKYKRAVVRFSKRKWLPKFNFTGSQEVTVEGESFKIYDNTPPAKAVDIPPPHVAIKQANIVCESKAQTCVNYINMFCAERGYTPEVVGTNGIRLVKRHVIG